jgi:hypothetical protein
LAGTFQVAIGIAGAKSTSGGLSVTLVDRCGYLTVVVEIEKDDNLVVRRPENVWYNTMHRVKESKTSMMQTTEQFWTKKKVTGSENIKAWRVARENDRRKSMNKGERRSMGRMGRNNHCTIFAQQKFPLNKSLL